MGDSDQVKSGFMSGCGIGTGVIAALIGIPFLLCVGGAVLSLVPKVREKQRLIEAQRSGTPVAPDQKPAEPVALFEIVSVTLRQHRATTTEALGEVKWLGESASIARMRIDVYDGERLLLDTKTFYLTPATKGQVTSFSTLIDIERSSIASYKLTAPN